MARTSTFYTSGATTTTIEVRQMRLGEAKPHGFGLRRRLAHRRNIKGDIIVLEQLRQSFSLKHSTVLTTLRSTSHLPQSCWDAHLGITGTSRPPVPSKGSYQTSYITIGMGLVTFETYTSVHQRNTSLQVPHLTPTTSRTFTTTSTSHPFAHNTYCDSDWAADFESRKSTSGTVTSVLGVPLAFNSRTQSTVATSSAEAELYAIGLGISGSLHIYQLLQELQQHLQRKTFDFGNIETQYNLANLFSISPSLTTTNHRFTSLPTAHQPSVSATNLASTNGQSTSL